MSGCVAAVALQELHDVGCVRFVQVCFGNQAATVPGSVTQVKLQPQREVSRGRVYRPGWVRLFLLVPLDRLEVTAGIGPVRRG